MNDFTSARRAAPVARFARLLPIAFAIAAPAAAEGVDDGAPSTQLEQIEVTAQRRLENLQTAPVAVSSIPAAQIQRDNLQTIRSIGQQVTSLYIPRSSINPSTAAYFIRGVGEADAVQSGAIGIYVDDVFLPRGLGSNYDFGDLLGVEVLRGPQGTLYGRNTAGGAIKIRTAEPRREFGFYNELGLGDYGQFNEKFGINTPIGDRVAVSADYVHRERDGTTRNVFRGNDTRNIYSDSIQLKALVQLSDSVKLLLNARGLEDRSTGGSVGSSVFVPGGALAAIGVTQDQVKPRTNWSQYPNNPNDMQTAFGAATLTWQIDQDHTLKSITSYSVMRQPGFYDTDLTPNQFSELRLRHRDHLATEELQYLGKDGPLHYVGGLYFFHETFHSYRITTQTPASNVPTATAQLGTERINSVAGFGQATYSVTPDLDLILGARYTFEHRHFRFTYGTTTPVRSLALSDAQHSWNSFTPKVSASYKLSDTSLAYASFSQGFKSGGYDNRSTTSLAATIPYQPEEVNSYEIGIKNEFFDHRFRVNLTAFYNDYSNFQATAREPITGTALRVNAGDAITKGAELETAWRILPGLTWTNNASYLSAQVTKAKDLLSDGTNTFGKRLPFSPRWALATGLTYSPEVLVAGGIVTLSATGNWQSTVYTDLQNSVVGRAPPQGYIDLGVSYETEDGHWLASVNVQNATDRTAQQGGSTAGTGTKAYTTANWSEPRFVLGRLKYRY